MKRNCAVVLSLIASFAMAEGADGAWRLGVGSAWRSRVKASVSGSIPITPIVPSHTVTYDKDIVGTASWSVGDVTTVPDNDPFASDGVTLYAVESIRTERTVTANGSAANLDDSDENSPLGIKAGIGCDFYDNGVMSVGLDLKFAAFWNMEAAVSGTAGGGTVRIQTMKDYFLFENGPYPGELDFTDFQPEMDPYIPYREQIRDTTTVLPSSRVRAMVTSDLYQVGAGPRFGWHICDWLDAYAGVFALCNIASVDFDVGSRGESSVECRFGVGADIGLAAWITDNFGLYAEAGYEWIDEARVNNDSMSAKLDYSSMIVGAGCIFCF